MKVLSEDCPRLFGSIEDDSVLLLGALQTLTGVNASTGEQYENAVTLALDEITKTIVGLPDPLAGPPRPLAILSCDSAATRLRAARHLTDDLHVPAIIGAGPSGLTLDVAQNVTIPAGTLLLSSSATTSALTNLNDQNLVWRTCPSDTLQALAVRDQIAAAQLRVVASGVDRVRLAVVFKGDAYGLGLAELALRDLELNGAVATAPSNADVFFERTYDGATDDFATLVADLSRFAPHVVVLFGTNEGVSRILLPLDESLVANGPSLPAYVLTDGLKVPELLAGANNESLRSRIRITAPAASGALADAFRLRYRSRFPALEDVFGVAGAYDALYLLAYGIVAAGVTRPTGKDIAFGLTRLSAGPTIEVGSEPINAALAYLKAGDTIDIEGASGPLNFDPATGEAPGDEEVFCIALDASGAPFFQASGRRYDAMLQKMTGADGCLPPGGSRAAR